MLAKSSVLLALAAAATAAPAPASPQLAARDTSDKPATLPESHWKEARLTTDGFNSDKWINGFEKAKAVVAGLTFEQKMNFTALGADAGGCSTRTYPLTPGDGEKPFQLCAGDATAGLTSRYSTQFPAPISAAATWSRDLIYARASAIGKENADVGIDTSISVVAGPLGRSPWGGRSWEGFSSEPFLAGEGVRLSVEGIQDQGVTAMLKHYIGNEQEWLRIGDPNGGYYFHFANQTYDSQIDEATLHELYLAPFVEGVRSGSGAAMCADSLINGNYSCESDSLLNQILKIELNFVGYVSSDFGAAYTTIGSALGGLDWVAYAFESGNKFGALLAAEIENGTLPADIADDKIIRMLTPYYALNQSSLPDVDYNRYVANEWSTEIARKVAEESMTLLKNVRSTNDTRGLPLNKPRDLLLVGSSAAPAPYGYLSNLHDITYYAPGNDYHGWVPDGFGAAGSPLPYAIDPLNAFVARGQKEDRPVAVDYFAQDDPSAGWVFTALGENVSYLDTKLSYASTAVVFVSAVAMEAFDRTSLDVQYDGDRLIKHVADRHNDTIVVVTAPGPVDMSAWHDHENVTSVVYAYYSGQEGGHAIAAALFGDVNPSGKLPFTIAKEVSDYDTGAYWNGSVAFQPKVNFTEGLFIDYKYFDKKGIEPLYEFGYGGSYSTFEMSDLAVAANATKVPALVRETNEKFFVDGKQTSGLYDVAYTVTASVKNTGDVAGAEVAQLYLSFPDGTPNKMPVRSLRGFAKPFLQPGASENVAFQLRNKDLAVWSVKLGGWMLPRGDFKLALGSSSRKVAATTTLTV
ncbi:glycoside hydrolase superfamily [Rhodotorula diobovata]|uniref:Probable beta-glucosidase G n=1 Tax=Rhodotorula diobovata TaxID=5288 RepID=A0A5C5FMH1_9BASI|nr:glycoside hydrolase superfamily [Rhodotorula diobovata]